MATKNDYYDLLGVTKTSSGQEIKNAYRKKALEWHPDRHQGADKEEAEKKFKEINEAYQVLSDSNKKSAYDNYGHDAFSPGGMGSRGGNPFAGAGQGSPFTYTWSSSGGQPFGAQGGNPFGNVDFGDPFDIFESFFGGGNPFGGQRVRQIPRYSVKLTFMEAVKGVEKEFDIEGRLRKIKIPAGVDEGTKINFGDFTLSVNVTPHEFFERDGDDIHINVTIPYSMAVLGGTIKVPTIDKEVKIKIRNGTASGTMIRLKGQGATNPHHKQKGDQYVKINILVPEKLNRTQKRIIDDLKEEGL
ncbi:MAG: DnaJ C-terminal domain-containing protein [bacterium]|nr:MAG: DnaJ C-terminal domain-containing protein [bacterium]